MADVRRKFYDDRWDRRSQWRPPAEPLMRLTTDLDSVAGEDSVCDLGLPLVPWRAPNATDVSEAVAKFK